jgi:hypothetical protein
MKNMMGRQVIVDKHTTYNGGNLGQFVQLQYTGRGMAKNINATK